MGLQKICPTCGTKHSKRGKYCRSRCSMWAVKDSVDQLREKKGPIYEKWKRKLKASLKRV